ncbi:TOX high mobility group box family member 4-B isoform X2 [Eucyclogobius newberryi]|uniref:TOX high mobility group box family member 4-B isoform X2 n=1 Tax=Eucyclogobius newberryi TaxID=166745 RepID=UPI003B5A3A48
MDLHFYSELSDTQNVDTEFLNPQAFSGYSEENKFSGGGDNYLTIDGGGHPFLSAEHTFHTPSLGDEVFEIPPISLDPDSALNISDAVSTFETPGSRSLVSNMVVETNDPSFASTFFNSGSQGMAQQNLRGEAHSEGSVLLSSSALEMGNSASHFGSSSPMTIDVQLGDIEPGLLVSGQLGTINPSVLTLGLGDISERSEVMPTAPSPTGSLQDEDMDDFKSGLAASTARRGGGKPATLASPTTVAKKPQKPVSAYALFFRDTQAAIKGQNPNASFGEVSKIVASMWDSLAEEQKQVYKKKTEMAKKGYLKALAAYKANQLSQCISEEMEAESTSPQGEGSPHSALSSTEESTPNIILNTGTKPTATAQSPTITKIIIPKHMLQPGRQVFTVLPGGVHMLQPTTLLISGAARGPPPLQQMQNAPPPPRLQQMAPAPPRLQAKPSTAQSVSVSAAPPPLQIKIVPASVQPATVELVSSADEQGNTEDDDVTEVEPVEEDVMEVSAPSLRSKMVCLRAGCNKPAVDSEDWDKEYCSNECVATHCRDIFQAWCSIKSQSVAAVK